MIIQTKPTNTSNGVQSESSENTAIANVHAKYPVLFLSNEINSKQPNDLKIEQVMKLLFMSHPSLLVPI